MSPMRWGRQIELDQLGELIDLLFDTHGEHFTAEELAAAEGQVA